MNRNCPRCPNKMHVVDVWQTRRPATAITTVVLRCPNPRCCYETTDFDIRHTPTRPAGTAVTADNYAPLRPAKQHPEQRKLYQQRTRARKAAAGN